VQERGNTQKTADARLAESLSGIAIEASAAILAIDFRKAGTRRKADSSAVTLADDTAQAIIHQGLSRLMPETPVVSEEALIDWQGKDPPREFLLVDPLDGTAEFIAGRLEYTVNIALVRNGTPVAGVVAAPALGLLWRGATDYGAELLRFPSGEANPAPDIIRTRSWPAGERIAVVSRSHYDPASAAFLERLAPVRTMESGSAIKFCRLAEGAADVYPRLAPTSEWDVAAGHAVVTAAGGVVLAPGGGALCYGRAGEGFRVPGFIAWGDAAAARKFGV
jgi:3'(2'), 5'-bisphosphate nucleotidase